MPATKDNTLNNKVYARFVKKLERLQSDNSLLEGAPKEDMPKETMKMRDMRVEVRQGTATLLYDLTMSEDISIYDVVEFKASALSLFEKMGIEYFWPDFCFHEDCLKECHEKFRRIEQGDQIALIERELKIENVSQLGWNMIGWLKLPKDSDADVIRNVSEYAYDAHLFKDTQMGAILRAIKLFLKEQKA